MSNIKLTMIVEDERSVRARDQNGSECSCEIAPDRLRLDTIKIFEDWLNKGRIDKRRELEVFGMHLYRMLFSGEVESFFKTKLLQVDPNQRLRVELSFHEKAFELARLPWEYLYYPETDAHKGFFFSTAVELVLSRFMSLNLKEKGHQPIEPGESPLRILIVVSQPEDLGPVVAEQVIEAIERLGDVKVDILDNPTVDNFLDKLRETQPHVLHFIGHGIFDRKENRGKIALLKSEKKSARWIVDNEFTDYFKHMLCTPQLVFLHLCESGVIDFENNFAGLAPQLILAGIPAVVAMQYPITNQAAISFCKNFYRELAKGEPIDQAVQYGRWRITADIENAYDTRVFGTPVLYLQSHEGIIRPKGDMDTESKRSEKSDHGPISQTKTRL